MHLFWGGLRAAYEHKAIPNSNLCKALGWTLAESSNLDWVATNHCAPGARMPIAGKESGSNFPCFGGWGGVMKHEAYDVVIFSAFLEASCSLSRRVFDLKR